MASYRDRRVLTPADTTKILGLTPHDYHTYKKRTDYNKLKFADLVRNPNDNPAKKKPFHNKNGGGGGDVPTLAQLAFKNYNVSDDGVFSLGPHLYPSRYYDSRVDENGHSLPPNSLPSRIRSNLAIKKVDALNSGIDNAYLASRSGHFGFPVPPHDFLKKITTWESIE